MKQITIVDSHTAGEPTRVVTGGLALAELEEHRRAIIAEPRGHEVIVGALLVEPEDKTCAARVVFFNNVGLLGMCGHGMVGLVETLRHMGRISAGEHRIETPVGVVTATLQPDGSVSVRNVPSWRKVKGLRLGEVTADIAWGGNWFLLVSNHGLELSLPNVRQLTEASLELRRSAHEAGYPEVDHVELFGPPHSVQNDSRNFVLCPGGEYDRSPCGTGTSAKMACLAADGLLAPKTAWRQEGILGTVFEGSYEPTTEGIIPTITGRAFITAEATLLFDPADPFRFGIS